MNKIEMKKLITLAIVTIIVAFIMVQLIEIEKVSGYIGFLLGLFCCTIVQGAWNFIERIFNGE